MQSRKSVKCSLLGPSSRGHPYHTRVLASTIRHTSQRGAVDGLLLSVVPHPHSAQAGRDARCRTELKWAVSSSLCVLCV
jgi:hypothetical protein